MKENEILEYRKQAYNELSSKMIEEFVAIEDNDAKFSTCLQIITDKILLEQDEQVKSKEREAAYRIMRSDLIKDAKDEQIKAARNYIPIPLSSYKDAEQERKTRPSGEDAEQRRAHRAQKEPSIPKPRQTDESKNIAAIAKAMGMDETTAKAWLEAQKTRIQNPQINNNNQPTNNEETT